MKHASVHQTISDRIELLQEWLETEAPHARRDQLHLDVDTPEQAYWHMGYLAALRDVRDNLLIQTADEVVLLD